MLPVRPTRWAVTSILLTLLAGVVAAVSATGEVVFSGYVQVRYSDALGELQPSTPGGSLVETPPTFKIRRARLTARARIDEHIGARVTISAAPTTSVLVAYGEYLEGPFQAQIGLSRIPFGYEIQLASSQRITLERSQAINKLIFPFAFDRGIFASYNPQRGINAAISIVNGRPFNVSTDDNDRKNMVGRIGYSIPRRQLGLSIYNGANPDTDLRLKIAGIDFITTGGSVTLLGEAVFGKDGERDPVGGYLTIAYRPAGSPSQPYLRLDIFDRDRDAGEDSFRRATVGYNHYLNPATKLTLEYEMIDDKREPQLKGRLAIQYQVVF